MSHFTSIQTQIHDVNALEAACTELGVELLHNAEARGYANQSRHGELVIRLKGPYDIAANRPEGSANNENRSDKPVAYELTTDWWDGHVEQEVGAHYGRLLQLYGVHKTIREANRKRLRVTRKQDQDGTIKLTLAA